MGRVKDLSIAKMEAMTPAEVAICENVECEPRDPPGYYVTMNGKNYCIPTRMMPGITRYINDHVEPGSFLCAVIRNDLKEAIGQADEENFANLPAFVSYFHNEAPGNCWGSAETMQAWLASRLFGETETVKTL